MQLKASAPGSLMLLGEYGVLYGKHALVCALDKRVTVTLTTRLDDRVEIESTLLGRYCTSLAELEAGRSNSEGIERFRFILAVLKHQLPKLKHGVDIHIESNFSDQIGFGSSAAVTVATLATFITLFNVKITPLELIRQARNIIRAVQGSGSGADIAASVYGGMVGYRAEPLWVEKYREQYPLTTCYAGYKTPTPLAIKQVEERFAKHPGLLKAIAESIGQCALEGMACVRQSDWKQLGLIMNTQQGMMDALGVNTKELQQWITILRSEPAILGAKISGAGLGDCVIGLGNLNTPHPGHIPVAMSLQGVTCEKI